MTSESVHAGPPTLVAHRGDQTSWPENTRHAVAAAVTAGAAAVEIDVQLSADRVPVLMHDARLDRTCGVNAPVSAMTADELAALGARHDGGRVPVPTLAAVVDELHGTGVEAFVEIKRAAVERFGVETVVERIGDVLAPLGEQAVVISFDERIIGRVKESGAGRTGWILPAYDDVVRVRAAALAPDVLVCKIARIDETGPLWPGRWRWMVYTVNDADTALAWGVRGAALVETDHVSSLLRDPRFRGETQGAG